MSSRSRPRNGSTKGDSGEQEEQGLWDSIKSGLKELAEIQKRQIEVFKSIEELEKEAAERSKTDDGGANVEEINAIQALYREHLQLAESEKQMLDGEPYDILSRLEILKAMRDASSEAQSLSVPMPISRSSSSSKPRRPKPLGRPTSAASSHAGGSSQTGGGGSQGGGKDGSAKDEGGAASGSAADGTDGASDAPGAAVPGRLKGSSSVRSSSVASRRDGTADPPAGGGGGGGGGGGSGGGGSDDTGTNAEKAGKLVKGAEVAYKHSKPKDDGGSWIQCIITNVSTTSSGIKRYEVQDPEPEEGSTGNGSGGAKYRTSAQALIAIPGAKEALGLPEVPVGKQVLARYPETTTFYRAEVLRTRKDKSGGESLCILRFEDDQDQELEVMRRYVLDVGARI